MKKANRSLLKWSVVLKRIRLIPDSFFMFFSYFAYTNVGVISFEKIINFVVIIYRTYVH